jgi:hypothetical protein
MKGHVGDGARSGGFKAPDTGFYMPSHTLSFVSITFDSAGIGSLNSGYTVSDLRIVPDGS